MTHRLLIPVTPGELVDRVTILRVKLRNCRDPDKIARVTAELNELTEIWGSSPFSIRVSTAVIRCIRELTDVNQEIWDCEDQIRATDIYGASGIVSAATKARDANNRRTALKARINEELGVETTEVKEYGGPREAQGQGS